MSIETEMAYIKVKSYLETIVNLWEVSPSDEWLTKGAAEMLKELEKVKNR